MVFFVCLFCLKHVRAHRRRLPAKSSASSRKCLCLVQKIPARQPQKKLKTPPTLLSDHQPFIFLTRW